jgi:dimethylaniline monooxygenase (N-oxide forming)
MSKLPSVCIIGAGSTGIAACKNFKDRGIPYDCFEKSDRIGGNWVFKNTNGMSSAYRSLHINTSRSKMEYADFPMPEDYPVFPHHSQVVRYFEDYVDHFGFRSAISFNREVQRAERLESGIWQVTLAGGEVRCYDALCVANGHHWNPRMPEPAFPGNFSGQQIHSHYYIDPVEPVDCLDKNVLVVGMGNSALDIACELGRRGTAKQVFLSTRRGYYIVPKYIGSDTLDKDDPHPSQDPSFIYRMTPGWFARWRRLRQIRAAIGRPEDYGLPKPDYPLGSTHPTISSEILIRVGSGDVLPRSNIAELMGDKVRFTDGVAENIDVIIYATGYNIAFPFFDRSFVSAPDNEIALYRRVIHPEYHNLFFLGLVQPLCAIMPIAEVQAKWLGAFLCGDYALPDPSEIEADTRQFHESTKGGYLKSARHTIQIRDCAIYTYELRKEWEAGTKRARKRGNPFSIPPRAQTLAVSNAQQQKQDQMHPVSPEMRTAVRSPGQ